MDEETRICLLFKTIGRIIGDRRCSSYRIEGRKFLKCKVVLEYDDAIEIYWFKYEIDRAYEVVKHDMYGNEYKNLDSFSKFKDKAK